MYQNSVGMFASTLFLTLFVAFHKIVMCSSVFPLSPCPNIFNYEMKNNEVRGVIRFQNDMTGYYTLELNMTLEGYVNENIGIQRLTPAQTIQNGEEIMYHITFPRSRNLPEVATVVFNNKLLCSAKRRPDPTIGGITSLTALDFFAAPMIVQRPYKPFANQQIAQPSKETFGQGNPPDTPSFPPNYHQYGSQMVAAPPPSSANIVHHTQNAIRPMSPDQVFGSQPAPATWPSKRPATFEPIKSLEDGAFFVSPSTVTRTTKSPMQPVNNLHQSTTPIPATTIKPSTVPQIEVKESTLPNKPETAAHIHISNTNINVFNNRGQEEECGVAEDTQALVVQGSPTTEGQYPWLIAMFHLQELTGEYKFKCAGNLISSQHVITAAHCVRIEANKRITKQDIILVLGKHNIRSWAVRSQIRDVRDIFVHPDYKRPSDADIAILKMYSSVEYSSTIKPVCLWRGEDDIIDRIIGTNGTVVGWGKDEYDNSYVPEPKELNMPIVSQEDCLRSDERFIRLTSHRTFCAGGRNGEGPCSGDSGGGFIMRRRGRWTLRGVVSSALVDPITRSCDVHNYMVFADVSKYMPWIKEIMKK